MKQKPEFFEQRYLKNGEVVLNRSNFSTKTKEIAREWIANIKAASFTKVTKDNNFIFSEIPYLTDTSKYGPINFANAIGISQLTPEIFDGLPAKDQDDIRKQIQNIRNTLKAAQSKPLPILTGKSIGIQSRLENIADILMNKSLAEDNESQHLNNDGKPTSNFVLNNWISYVFNVFKESPSVEEFGEKIPWLDRVKGDIFSRDTRLLNRKMYNEAGKRNQLISLGVTEGRKSDITGAKSVSKMSLGERVLFEFNNNLRGIFNVLIPADAKTEWIIDTSAGIEDAGGYIPLTVYKDTLRRKGAKQTYFFDVMKGYLETEIALAKDFNNRKHIQALNIKDTYGREMGKSLRFFKEILDRKTVEAIHSDVIDGDKSLFDVVTAEEIDNQVQAFLREQSLSTVSMLTKYGFVIDKSDKEDKAKTFEIKGFLTDVKEDITGKGKVISSDALRDLIEFREMNFILNNIEMHKVFFGDPAQFADAEKRFKSFMSGREYTHHQVKDGVGGFNEWANVELNKGLKPGDPGYTHFKNHLTTATVYDVKVSSSEKTLTLLRERINSKLPEAYERGNEADAASVMLPTAYREFLYKAGGRFDEAQERLFQWHMAYERFMKNKKGQYQYSSEQLQKRDARTLRVKDDAPLSVDLINRIKSGKPKGAFFHILKPIVSGVVFEEGVARTDLVKTSAMPLFYEWIEGVQLTDLYDVMQKKGIDYILMNSAHKVGATTDTLVTLYNEEGKINKEGIGSTKVREIPYRNIGIQVETAGQHDKNTQGSQLNKLDTTDMYSDGVPQDFEAGTESNRIEEWDFLTEDQKRNISELHRVAAQLKDSKEALTAARYESVLKELDIIEVKVDGKPIGQYRLGKKGHQKIVDHILIELQRRQLPINLAEAISSDEIDFESIASYKQIRDIIYSIIDKKIVRPKVNGGSHIMAPVTGWELEQRKLNSKNVWTSSRLKFYSVGKSGNTEACQILLPNKFRGIPLGKIDPELLRGIGFRIPTQGLNSVEYFEVVDFLPEDMGDAVVFPAEITTKAGSDFDIDKMNLYLKNWYQDFDGNAKEIKWQGNEEKTKEYIRDIVGKGLFLTLEEKDRAKEWIDMAVPAQVTLELSEQDEDTPLILIANKVKSVFALADDITYSEALRFFIETEDLMETQVQELYMKALENRYLDALIRVITLPRNFEKLTTPNTQEFFSDGSPGLKEIAKKIKRLTTPKNKQTNIERNTNTDHARLLRSSYMTETRHNFVIGKEGVGVGAVSNTNLSVNQVSRIIIPFDTKIKVKGRGEMTVSDLGFNFNEIIIDGKKYISLSGVYDKLGKIQLAGSGSQYIDGYVDIAKGSWIVDLGADSDQAATYLFMNKAGEDPETYALFLNQPIIREYIEKRKINDAQVSLGVTTKRLSAARNRKDVLKLFGAAQGHKTINKPPSYDKKTMETMIKKWANGVPLDEYEKNLQRYMIDDFSVIESLKWELYRVVQGYNYDTQKINDHNSHNRKIIQTTQAEESKIKGVNRVFDNTFIGEIRSSVDKLNNAFAQVYFKLHKGQSGRILFRLAEEVKGIKRIGQEEYKYLMDRAEMSLLNYIVANDNVINGKSLSSWLRPLIVDTDHQKFNTALYIEAMKKHADPSLKYNTFLEAVVPYIDKRPGYPSTVELKENIRDAQAQNIMSDDFNRLMQSNIVITINGKAKPVSLIMENLIITGILQTGVSKTKTSWNHIVPEHAYKKYVKNKTDSESDLLFFLESDLFYRTNWDNDTLVPEIRAKEVEVGADLVYKFPMFQGMLRLPTYEYLDRKFVKIVTYPKIRDSKTGKMKLDYDNKIVTLYKRIDKGDGDPYVLETAIVENGVKTTDTKKEVFYKPAIKYGARGVSEFYNVLRPSVLSENQNVPKEMSDLAARKVITPSLFKELEEEYSDGVRTYEADPSFDDIYEFTDDSELPIEEIDDIPSVGEVPDIKRDDMIQGSCS
jgi:hypothetical protein